MLSKKWPFLRKFKSKRWRGVLTMNWLQRCNQWLLLQRSRYWLEEREVVLPSRLPCMLPVSVVVWASSNVWMRHSKNVTRALYVENPSTFICKFSYGWCIGIGQLNNSNFEGREPPLPNYRSPGSSLANCEISLTVYPARWSLIRSTPFKPSPTVIKFEGSPHLPCDFLFIFPR